MRKCKEKIEKLNLSCQDVIRTSRWISLSSALNRNMVKKHCLTKTTI